MSRPRYIVAIALAVVVFGFALALSQWLQVTPSGVLWNRNNVLFDGDTANTGRVLLGLARPQYPQRHPLAPMLWVPVVTMLRSIVGLVLPPDWAPIVAVRVLLAGLTGIGYGLLAAAALSRGASRVGVIAIGALSMLATSMTLVVVPEFYGLSHGLLAIAAGIAFWRGSAALRVGLLLALAIVTGGTTITNVLLPVGLAAAVALSRLEMPDRLRKNLLRLIAFTVLIGIVLAVALVLGPLRRPLQRTRAGVGVGKSTHYRLITQPAQAARFAVNGLVFPIVGPTPARDDPRRLQLTYQPYSVLDLSRWQAASAAAWMALFAIAVVHACRHAADRLIVVTLLGWIAGNLLLHNIWGYEFMLYTPHWSLALLAITWIGGTRLRPAFLVPLVIVIAAGEIQTLQQIIGALSSS